MDLRLACHQNNVTEVAQSDLHLGQKSPFNFCLICWVTCIWIPELPSKKSEQPPKATML